MCQGGSRCLRIESTPGLRPSCRSCSHDDKEKPSAKNPKQETPEIRNMSVLFQYFLLNLLSPPPSLTRDLAVVLAWVLYRDEHFLLPSSASFTLLYNSQISLRCPTRHHMSAGLHSSMTVPQGLLEEGGCLRGVGRFGMFRHPTFSFSPPGWLFLPYLM